ncbi:MAG: hypothetical protein CFE24_15165 [Flavobacterium sp. BFFFF2]|nr:MAG: hypothetical protein CFE24_15165 [Flavobacterium sp. BFFFF2]
MKKWETIFYDKENWVFLLGESGDKWESIKMEDGIVYRCLEGEDVLVEKDTVGGLAVIYENYPVNDDLDEEDLSDEERIIRLAHDYFNNRNIDLGNKS